MSITSAPFGVTRSGQPVTAYTLANSHGCKAVVLDFGGTVQSLIVPDRDGQPTDVVLGYDSVEKYETSSCFYGAFVGRYANRICGSRFPLDGREVRLTPNMRQDHLHGNFSFEVYDAAVEGNSLVLRRTSPDGEDGYPGAVTLTITYTLTEQDGLVMDYRATTDRPTVINLTNHSYFNLSGHASGTALDTVLQLNASRITEIDGKGIPTGVIRDLSPEDPFNFTVPKPIARDIEADDPQLRFGGGYDHNFILGLPSLETPVATAVSPRSGILMDVYTTQPAVQFYSANAIQHDPAGHGKEGTAYPRRGGFCLETQHYPDSPNRPEFPSTELRPGEAYHQVTEYRFSVSD
ncbi:MAG: galactose mutarotase [Clostridiales bacterium]|nr:galactose mutarotase [Clostridiales bacterium]